MKTDSELLDAIMETADTVNDSAYHLDTYEGYPSVAEKYSLRLAHAREELAALRAEALRRMHRPVVIYEWVGTDWTRLYIDGVVVYENHTINGVDVLHELSYKLRLESRYVEEPT